LLPFGNDIGFDSALLDAYSDLRWEGDLPDSFQRHRTWSREEKGRARWWLVGRWWALMLGTSAHKELTE
jgi:hypothetical protein